MQTSSSMSRFQGLHTLQSECDNCWSQYHHVVLIHSQTLHAWGVRCTISWHVKYYFISLSQLTLHSSTALGEGLNSIVCYCELNQSFTRIFQQTNYLSCLGERNVKWKNNPLGCLWGLLSKRQGQFSSC